MIDLINEIMQTLRNNKVRTVLTGIAVTWGVFMLIVLLGVARGVTNSFDSQMMQDNTTRLRVFGGRTSVPWEGNREGRRIRLEESDLQKVPAGAPKYVESVTTRINGGATVSTSKAKVNQSYTGAFPQIVKELGNFELTEGRFLNEPDIENTRKVAVLPKYYITQLFPPDGNDALGKEVTINGLAFKVVGIYDSRWNRDIYIPFTTARLMAPDRKDLGELSVNLMNVTTEEDGKEAENLVKNTLAKSHNFNPDDESAIWISNYFTNALTAKKGMAILDVGVWVLGILTLLTGIVGISNIMFVSVRERTHEIGIRRAIGAKPRKILTQILSEAVAITLIFGYIGIVLGTVVTQVIATVVGDDGPLENPTVSLSIAVEVTVVLVLAGALAGLFPALKALKVKPVEALRDE
ncbi:MAG: ABC transporter permease [Muribaculaceae bacterium]|nr:ABC transporter permease [Muribaculaceae bacterium]